MNIYPHRLAVGFTCRRRQTYAVPRVSWWMFSCFFSLAIILCFGMPAHSQPADQDSEDPATEDDFHTLYYSAHLPTDRRLSQLLDQSEHLIAEQRFSEAIPFLERVLTAEEDGFYLGDNWQTVASGLKSRACELLKSLPAEGRAEYELQQGVAARRALRDAVDRSDTRALAETVRKYPVTDAAAEAALVLAALEFDEDEAASGAGLVERVASWPTNDSTISAGRWLQASRLWAAAGRPQRVAAAIEHARNQSAMISALRLNGQPVGDLEVLSQQLQTVAINRAQSLANPSPGSGTWLDPETWPQEGGSNDRAVVCTGGVPHLWPQWKERTIQDGQHLLSLSKRREDLLRKSRTWPLATSPVAVGSVVVVRTPTQLVAIDWNTGKRVWESRSETIDNDSSTLTLADRTDENSSGMITLSGIEQRVWLDATYGGISSDSHRVYCIRGLDTLGGNVNRAQFGAIRVFGGRNDIVSNTTNVLVAYDLESEGKLVWQADGTNKGGPYSGASFLGPPVATSHGLFVLAELGNAVQVLQIDAATGKLIWKQPLLNLERGLDFELGRRLAGSSPSFANGLLICPTGAGSVIAIDPVARQLRWAYRFPVSEEMASRRSNNFNRGYNAFQPTLDEQWARCRATIAGDRVLVTSPESDELYCLAIDSGELLWSNSREHGLFIGGILYAVGSDGSVEGGAIVVGNGNVHQLDLATGQEEWSIDVLPDQGTVGGFGILTEGNYLLPLLDGRLLVIDVETGQVVSTFTARETESLGNLICHQGAIVSQSLDAVRRFDQAAALQERATGQLARQPNDASALRTMAEFALIDGDTAEAVSLLLRAYGVAPDDALLQSRLRDALLTGLATDYAGYRQYAVLLDELIPNGSQRVELLRLHLDGCRTTKEYDAALNFAWQLFVQGNDTLLRVETDHWVLSERWLNARFRELWDLASPGARERLATEIDRWSEGVADSGRIEGFSRLYRYCIGIPPATEPALILAAQLLADNRIREAEMMLLALDQQPLADRQAARLASLWESLTRQSPAIPPDHGFDWPVGRVTTSTDRIPFSAPPQGRQNNQGDEPERARLVSRMNMQRQLGPTQLALTGSGTEVLGWNDLGEVVFRFGVELDHINRNGDKPNITCFRVGHFCVINQQSEVIALDLRARSDTDDTPLVWRSRSDGNRNQSRFVQQWQGNRLIAVSNDDDSLSNSRFGQVCTASPTGVVVRNGSQLSCLDPLTGDLLWKRGGLPSDGPMLADERHVYLSGEEGMVVNMVDGTVMSQWTPIDDKFIATDGVRYVVAKLSGGKRVLTLADAGSPEPLLERKYSSAARMVQAENNWLLVVDPSGIIEAIDLASGKLLWTTPTSAQPGLDTVEVFAAGNTLYLTTNTRTEAQHRAGGHEAIDNAPLARGKLYALDAATGRPRWPRPATVAAMGLLQIQPIDSPLLVLASHHSGTSSNGSKSLQLLCIDRVTGRSLFLEDELRPVRDDALVVRLKRGPRPGVTINLEHTLVNLDFTDLPFPPEPVTLSEVEIAANQRPSSIFGRLGRFLGGSIDAGPIEIDDDD